MKRIFILRGKQFPYLIAALISSIVAIGYAVAFQKIQSLSYSILIEHPFFFIFLSPVLFVAAWFLIYRFSKESAGSGIPQVMAGIELINNKEKELHIHRLLSIKVAVVKFISSLLMLFGGGAIGREGPTVHISACIFDTVGLKLKKYWPKVDQTSLIVAGGAAGIAAAFNTPLGGIVYAIEELAPSNFSKVRTPILVSVLLAGIVSQLFLGGYLYLGYPKLQKIGFEYTTWAIIVGIAGGFFGAWFGKILNYLVKFKAKIISIKYHIVIAVICGFVASLISVFLYKNFAGSGKEIIMDLLFSENKNGGLSMFLARYFSPIVSYFAGAAGGIFAPSLAAGASMGSYIAHLFNLDQPNLFILLGMVSFLTGVTGAPFTSFVLVLEMTDRHSAILVMMLSAVASILASRFVDKSSFYEYSKRRFLRIEGE